MLKVSNRKPNKLWTDQGRELYNKLMQEWLDNKNILIYSIHNKRKSVIIERFPKTLKAKIYKKVAVYSSKPYLAYLNGLIDQYNNTHHHSINTKPLNAEYSDYC